MKTWLGTDSGYRRAKWQNSRSKRIICGYYRYNWSSDNFNIIFDEDELSSGSKTNFISYGDIPHIDNWKFLGRVKT